MFNARPPVVPRNFGKCDPKKQTVMSQLVQVPRESDLPCPPRRESFQYSTVPVRMVLEHPAKELCSGESRGTFVNFDMWEGLCLVAISLDMSTSCFTVTALPIRHPISIPTTICAQAGPQVTKRQPVSNGTRCMSNPNGWRFERL